MPLYWTSNRRLMSIMPTTSTHTLHHPSPPLVTVQRSNTPPHIQISHPPPSPQTTTTRLAPLITLALPPNHHTHTSSKHLQHALTVGPDTFRPTSSAMHPCARVTCSLSSLPTYPLLPSHPSHFPLNSIMCAYFAFATSVSGVTVPLVDIGRHRWRR
jgi:hypothetical protein